MAGDNRDLKKKIKGYSNAMNAMEYEAALDQYYTNKRNEDTIADLKDKSAVRQWEENEKVRQLKIANATDQFDKNQKTYETTLNAIDFAARDAEDRVRLGLDEQIAEFAFQYDDLERDMIKKGMEAGLQYDQKEQSLEAARITDMTQQENIKLERTLKTKEYDIQDKQQKSEYQKNQLDLTIKNIQAQGQARAQGRLGKSAKRAVNTVKALSGINQQQLSDNLYFSQQSLEAKRKFDLGDGKGGKKGFRNMSLKKAGQKGGRLGLQAATSKKTKRNTSKGLKAEQKYITKTLGITNEEFNMSREKLAESLASASKSSELKLKVIKTKEFEAKGQAFAQKMVAPRFGSSAPVPFKTPKTEYTRPMPAPTTPMMANGMGRAAQRPASGASTALGIGSAALGVASMVPGPHMPFAQAGAGILGGLSKLFA